MDFTPEQQTIIYNAVRYYQMNRVPLDGNEYQSCDEILNQLFPEVIVPQPPHRPPTGFGFNV